MKVFFTRLLVAVFILGLGVGCPGEAAKGVNKDKDKPRPADKAPAK